jgi:hypothetical protein
MAGRAVVVCEVVVVVVVSAENLDGWWVGAQKRPQSGGADGCVWPRASGRSEGLSVMAGRLASLKPGCRAIGTPFRRGAGSEKSWCRLWACNPTSRRKSEKVGSPRSL